MGSHNNSTRNEKVIFKRWGYRPQKEYGLTINSHIRECIGPNLDSKDRVEIDIFDDEEVKCGGIHIFPYCNGKEITAEIGNLYTEPGYGGRGIGTFLMIRCAEEAKMNGYVNPWFFPRDEESGRFQNGLMIRFIKRGIDGIIWDNKEEIYFLDLDKIDFETTYFMFGYTVEKQ